MHLGVNRDIITMQLRAHGQADAGEGKNAGETCKGVHVRHLNKRIGDWSGRLQRLGAAVVRHSLDGSGYCVRWYAVVVRSI